MAYCQRSRADGGLGDINFPILADLNKSVNCILLLDFNKLWSFT
jgi:hypothetical protein